MNLKVLLLLVPLLLGGVAVWLVQSDGEPPLPSKVDAVTAAPGAGDAIAADAKAVEATSHGSDSNTVRAAATATDQRVPFPEDAVFIEVRVVDKATGEPVPEATVTWSDQTTHDRIRKDPAKSQEERNWLTRDIERLNQRFGWQAISDASGLVRVHLGEQTLVVARHEGRYGTLRLQKNTIAPRGGYRVELEPDIEVLVQVLDAQGQPAVAVPIAVTQNDAQGKMLQIWRWESQAITRAPDGIAALRHLQEWRAEAAREGNKFEQWRARTFLPGYEDQGVAFSIDAPTKEPIVLRLPPCGSVRVRAELHGAALTAIKNVNLSEVRNRSGERSMRSWMFQRSSRSRPTDADGWAIFDHVPLGISYRASASLMSGYMAKEFKGPMTQDHAVTVLLTLADDQILLTGRLLDEQKTVLADQEFTVNVRAQQNEGDHTFRSDAQGRFLLFLGPLAKDVPRVQRVCIAWRQPGSVLQAELSNRDFRAGLQDAGDVVLQAGKLVVAGRLVSGDGPCKANVQPSVERREVVEGKPERWRRQRDLQFHKDDKGHFAFRGEAPPGRYRLTCSSDSHLPIEPIEFALGAKDLVVNVDSGSPLAASVLLPKNAPEGLRAVLVGDGPAPPTAVQQQNWRYSSDRLVAQPWSREEGRYQVQWGSIAPGTYTLQLQLWCAIEPLVSIPGVQVPGPKGGDSRLVDIDLRSLVRIATVKLFDQNGQPIESYDGALFPIGQDPDKEWLGYDIQGTQSRLLVRPQPLDLLVARRGFRPQPIRCAGETTEAKLDPWPTVEVVFDAVPELPKETTLHARMTLRESREAKYRTLYNEGDRNDVMAAPRSNIKVEQGRAKLPIGDGPHDVTVSVGNRQRSIGVGLPRGEPVFANAQSLRVALPAAGLQQALKELKAPENEK